ncbi:MAG: Eco57I restriction-modification methylase domain-containing protein [Gemmatimonadaceae bacterium]|nr:Eco57I restriction-modification methylase domain-containing protein [Gemmatimonadaceae bacterium]
MKGFVPTPAGIVDRLVEKLMAGVSDPRDLRVLDPGCGEGEFIEGLLRYCERHRLSRPRIVGIELDPGRASVARQRFSNVSEVEIREADFLVPSTERFELIVGNPPYVSILELSQVERSHFRHAYESARGRFDLYVLFFEQAMRMLATGGRLVFITPEKYLYVESARGLRKLLLSRHVSELHFADESTFGALVTYPLVTTVSAEGSLAPTRVIDRDGTERDVRLESADSWLPTVRGHTSSDHRGLVLGDVALRVSCGVATGADQVFVVRATALSPALTRFAHPTLSGRQIALDRGIASDHVMLAPYDDTGRLLPESSLGVLGAYLNEPSRRAQLERRTCTARKKWFAFHDNLPLDVILRPKLLCKDITETPFFVVDEAGLVVPRHSVYYVVPVDPSDLGPLASYLNSAEARDWMRSHCQRAAKGFLRMQSHTLKQLPLPPSFAAKLRGLPSLSTQLEARLA